MTLPELSIKRHVLAYMVSAVLVLFGIVSYTRLGVDRFPSIDTPIITVTTMMRGVSPEIIDSSITNVIETSVNSVPGITHISSSSSPGISVVTASFNLNKSVDVAFSEVQAKVNQALRNLPKDADQPVVAKVDIGASPIFWMALQGDRTQQQLNQYARLVIKKKLETIDGVGEVRLGGRRDRTIRVDLDPERMAAAKISPQDIVRAFNNEHLQAPAGFLVGAQSEFMVTLDFEFHTLEDLRRMVLAYRSGAAVRLSDVATVEDGLADYRQTAHFGGKATVGIGIVKIAGTNTVAIIEEIKRRLDAEILPQLPPGMTIKISTDDSTFINEMVKALKEHLVLGTLLAALVVLIFLKSIRSTLIIATAIPVSLLGAVAVMYFAGFTFNSLTLLALLLLVGVVVDDAIVVLENIFRHREKGEPDPIKAAISGTRQVVFAVLAATLSLVAIFTPVIFLGGIIGRFFQSFAIVVVFGVMVSWLVSMTLTPMLCSRYLKVAPQHNRVYTILEDAFLAVERFYKRMLALSLRHRWKVVAATIAIVSSSAFFFGQVGKGFVPDEDEGRFMVMMKTPLGSNIDYTNNRLEQVERILGTQSEVLTYFTAIGLGQAGQVNQAMAFVRLKPHGERSRHQKEIVGEVSKKLAQLPGVRAFAMPVPMMGGQRGDPLQFSVVGPNLQEVARYSKLLNEKLANVQGLGRLDLALELDLPTMIPLLDRGRLADLGLTAQDVAVAIQVMAGGMNISRYSDKPGDGERYDIRIKAKEGSIMHIGDLNRIYLRNNQNNLVRLDTAVAFQEFLGPASITRLDLQYGGGFFGTPSIALGEAVNKIQAVSDETLPIGYSVKFTGQAEEFAKTIGYMAFAFLMATLLLYMVLASQFNSFLQPMIIMVAQPLAMIGGVAALWMFGHSLNIYSMIGLVLLIGLVAKNSILLVDLTNQLRAEGREIDDALLEACPIRMRPVVMTSLTIILALLPAALGISAGADTNGPLSVAVIGGMITSTLLTLVVVPVVYSLSENAVLRLQKRRTSGWRATKKRATT
ncbi:MAG: efflux RND transporter permease subunit [Pseudomonadota bacterium]